MHEYLKQAACYKLLDVSYPGMGEEGFMPVPTQAEVAKWLREKHNCHIVVEHNMHYAWQVKLSAWGYPDTPASIEDDGKWLANDYNTYEEALEAGIEKALTKLSQDV